RNAIPGAVLADKGAGAVGLRQRAALAERQTERSDVIAERVVRHDRLRHRVRVLRLDPIVDLLPPIAERPALERARFPRGRVVRTGTAAGFVAFVPHGP